MPNLSAPGGGSALHWPTGRTRRRWLSRPYALLEVDETALLGCAYIDPPQKPGADAEVSWCVVDECLGTDLAAALDALVPRWIAKAWPFQAPRHVGRDLSWEQWLALG